MFVIEKSEILNSFPSLTDKPKFPVNTPSEVYINRAELAADGQGLAELNITCIVDADPPALLYWYDAQRMVQIDKNRLSGDILGIFESENMSILKFRYKPAEGGTGNGGNSGNGFASGSRWPPNSGGYEKPTRAQLAAHPERQFECRAKNDMGLNAQKIWVKVGDLPPSPRLLSYTYEENNLTLTIEEASIEPPLDKYRIEVAGVHVHVEFNASGEC